MVAWKESVLNQVFCEDGKNPSVPSRMENFFSIRVTKLIMKDCAVWRSLSSILTGNVNMHNCMKSFLPRTPISLFHAFILIIVSTRH
jgi:hypothetical protein